MAHLRVRKPEFNVRAKLNELDYGHVPYHKMPPGSIIQTVVRTTTNQTNITVTGYEPTDIYCTICPKFPSSKILIMVSGGMNGMAGGSEHSYTVLAAKVYRQNSDSMTSSGYEPVKGDGTDSISVVSQGHQRTHLDAHKYIPMSINIIDKPKTTKPITYKVYGSRPHGTNSTVSFVRDSNNQAQMVLMEIKQ